MRLIDADKLPKYINKEDIDSAPTVDAIQVVRCKDCKHWDGVPIADDEQSHECHLIDGNKEKIRIATPSDWFCPRGERREE